MSSVQNINKKIERRDIDEFGYFFFFAKCHYCILQHEKTQKFIQEQSPNCMSEDKLKVLRSFVKLSVLMMKFFLIIGVIFSIRTLYQKWNAYKIRNYARWSFRKNITKYYQENLQKPTAEDCERLVRDFPMTKTDKAKTKEVSRKVKDRDSLLESNCCMCGKQIMEEDEYHQLPVCLHNYHPKCLDRLMEDGNTSCILCNNNLRVATIKKIYGIDMQDDQ